MPNQIPSWVSSNPTAEQAALLFLLTLFFFAALLFLLTMFLFLFLTMDGSWTCVRIKALYILSNKYFSSCCNFYSFVEKIFWCTAGGGVGKNLLVNLVLLHSFTLLANLVSLSFSADGWTMDLCEDEGIIYIKQ